MSFVRAHRSVRVRASGIDFIDSSGLSALVDSARLAGDLGGKLWLDESAELLRRVLASAGFLPLFGLGEPPASLPVRPEPSPTVRPLQATLVVWCCLETPAAVRAKIADLAARLPFDADEISEIKLAVGEAVSNACRHGRSRYGDPITVMCRVDSSGLSVQVRDRGNGFDASGVPLPDSRCFVAGGRGIYFMKATMDEVSIESGPDGTHVKMFKSPHLGGGAG